MKRTLNKKIKKEEEEDEAAGGTGNRSWWGKDEMKWEIGKRIKEGGKGNRGKVKNSKKAIYNKGQEKRKKGGTQKEKRGLT